MKVLITNDDGIHSQGLIELAKRISREAEVFVVAPITEKSGVSQSITFLRPMFPVPFSIDPDDRDADTIHGFALDGNPADCAKLGLAELCPWMPDLVLSGINSGLNAGINVGYSGTVGAALAASVYGVRAISISLESSLNMDFARASDLVWPLIESYREVELPSGNIININFPTASLKGNADVVVVPVNTNPLGSYDKGVDPKGRTYYWAINDPAPNMPDFLTDTEALIDGKITVSLLSSDLNCAAGMIVADEIEAIERGR